jgi:hypothetical protein
MFEILVMAIVVPGGCMIIKSICDLLWYHLSYKADLAGLEGMKDECIRCE